MGRKRAQAVRATQDEDGASTARHSAESNGLSHLNRVDLSTDELMSKLALTAKQVGLLLEVRAFSVDNLRKHGKLPAVQIGKHWRYRPADVRRYIQSLK